MSGAGDRSQLEIVAEINFPHPLVLQNLVRLALGDDSPLVDDVGPIADAQGLAHVMVGDQDSDPPLTQELDDALDIDDGNGIDAGTILCLGCGDLV